MDYIYMSDIIYYDKFFNHFCFKDNYSNGFVFLIKKYDLYHSSIFNFYIEEDLDDVNHIYECHPEEEYDFYLIDFITLKIFKVK